MAAILIGCSIIAITQWDNIQAIILGLQNTPEELDAMQQNVKKDFEDKTGLDLSKIEEASKHINPDGTPIEDVPGEETLPAPQPESPATVVPAKPSDTKPEKPDQSNTANRDTAEVEQIMARFYALQSKFIGQLESLKNSTLAEYQKIPVKKRTIAIRSSMARNAVAKATAMENQCDALMAALLQELRVALQKADLDLSLVSDVEYYYASQKSFYKASYMSQFSKYLN